MIKIFNEVKSRLLFTVKNDAYKILNSARTALSSLFRKRQSPQNLVDDAFFNKLIIVNKTIPVETYLDYHLSTIQGKRPFVKLLESIATNRKEIQDSRKKWDILRFVIPGVKNMRALTEQCVDWAKKHKTALTISKAKAIKIVNEDVSEFKLLRLLDEIVYVKHHEGDDRLLTGNRGNVAQFANLFECFDGKDYRTMVKHDIREVKSVDEGRITAEDEVKLKEIMKQISKYLTHDDGKEKRKGSYKKKK